MWGGSDPLVYWRTLHSAPPKLPPPPPPPLPLYTDPLRVLEQSGRGAQAGPCGGRSERERLRPVASSVCFPGGATQHET